MYNQAAIFLAGGNSSRMNGFTEDKILALIGRKPVFAYSLETFLDSQLFSTFIFVCRNEDQEAIINDYIKKHLKTLNAEVIYEPGGDSRQQSVLNGLHACPKETDYVFIHDLARPLVSLYALRKLQQEVMESQAAALAHRPIDTIHQQTEDHSLTPLSRENLWAMETPQAFNYTLIHNAYKQLIDSTLTDCASALAILNTPVSIVSNPSPNPKLTKKEDFHYIKSLISNKYNDFF